ncbi:AN1-type zinc finger domain-containing protein [Methanoregula sp.]|uniref:AN1-type zinc finger domain-containing protein n=1 Tax=Methanoregula sp. TaxID=2052170 RepID=UPI003D125E05
MHRCHVCRKILGELPFTCQWCGHIFCFDHFMPDNHQCSRPRQYDQNLHLKVCRNCGRELKGKLVPCHWCGRVLCDYCRSAENHICRNKFRWLTPP